MILIFLLHGIFVDDSVYCLELGSECGREEYHQFLDDDINFPYRKKLEDFDPYYDLQGDVDAST